MLKAANNGFFFGLVAAVGLAWLAPGFGARSGPLPLAFLVPAGIVLIFFSQGLVLPTSELAGKSGAWRLHGLLQGITFVVIPVAVWTGVVLLGEGMDPGLRLGFLYLAILPTTISTAAIFTSNSGGNVALAVFNIVISSLLAIVLVPAWIWLVAGAEVRFEFVRALLRVFFLMGLPLLAGQLARCVLADWAEGHRAFLSRCNNGVILLIVYASLCDALVANAFSGGRVAWQGTLGAVLLFAAVTSAVLWVAQVVRLSLPDKKAFYFCASQKSLAVGAGMMPAVFGAHLPPELFGPIVLPVLVYHVVQLTVGAIIVERWRQNRLALSGNGG